MMNKLKLLAGGNDSTTDENLLIKPDVHVQVQGVSKTGLLSAFFGDQVVYISQINISINDIKKYNNCPHGSRIIAVLETSADDE